MRKLGFTAPPGIVKLGERFDGVACCLQEGGDQGNRLHTKAFALAPVLELSHLQAVGQVRKLLLVHPRRPHQRFAPVDAWGVGPALWEPAGPW